MPCILDPRTCKSLCIEYEIKHKVSKLHIRFNCDKILYSMCGKTDLTAKAHECVKLRLTSLVFHLPHFFYFSCLCVAKFPQLTGNCGEY